MRWIASLLLVLTLAACGDEDGPYLDITGGGFVFNYRIAEVYYGVVATALRPLPEGAKVMAEFEDPAGGPPFAVPSRAGSGTSRFVLDSPPVNGVVAGRDYRVVVRLESADGSVIETHEKMLRSKIDQSVMPAAPLTVGPGYTKNPAAGAKPQ